MCDKLFSQVTKHTIEQKVSRFLLQDAFVQIQQFLVEMQKPQSTKPVHRLQDPKRLLVFLVLDKRCILLDRALPDHHILVIYPCLPSLLSDGATFVAVTFLFGLSRPFLRLCMHQYLFVWAINRAR